MNKENFDKLIKALKAKSYNIKFECHIFAGKLHIRGIYIYNTDNKNTIKSLIDKEILKYIKLQNTLSWYLGERKEIILLQFKEEITLEIPEAESYGISNLV